MRERTAETDSLKGHLLDRMDLWVGQIQKVLTQVQGCSATFQRYKSHCGDLKQLLKQKNKLVAEMSAQLQRSKKLESDLKVQNQAHFKDVNKMLYFVKTMHSQC